MRTLVFDTETTGLINHPHSKEKPRIIEFAGIIVDETGKELETFHSLVDPGMELPPKITKITGITDDDLVDAPDFSDISQELRAFFSKADALLAHNLPFDYGMMELELKRINEFKDWPWPGKLICTVQEHAEEWGKRPKLIELYNWYFGKPLNQTHRALDDVRALVEVAVAAGVLP